MNPFIPNETYSKISDISLDYLINDIDIKGLIFDFDGTLMRGSKLSNETFEFINKAKMRGLKISVLSNNIHLDESVLQKLNITTTKKFALKPLKKPFLTMAKRMKLSPIRIAVIGNNRLSDIFGANRAKMYSIYIQNLNGFMFKLKLRDKLKNLGIKHTDD